MAHTGTLALWVRGGLLGSRAGLMVEQDRCGESTVSGFEV